jgi:predicted nucleic acid-binding protein
MKVAFDTSVLVAALLSSHRDHLRALAWLGAVSDRRLNGVVGAHALAEVWSVLTKLPVSPPITAASARAAVGDILAGFEVVPPTVQIYVGALDRCASKGLRSGAIFDALHLATAEAAGAGALLTFNERDFTRLSIAGGPSIVVPPDPPAIIF